MSFRLTLNTCFDVNALDHIRDSIFGYSLSSDTLGFGGTEERVSVRKSVFSSCVSYLNLPDALQHVNVSEIHLCSGSDAIESLNADAEYNNDNHSS